MVTVKFVNYRTHEVLDTFRADNMKEAREDAADIMAMAELDGCTLIKMVEGSTTLTCYVEDER